MEVNTGEVSAACAARMGSVPAQSAFIESLAQTLIVEVEEGLAAPMGPKRASELIQQKRVASCVERRARVEGIIGNNRKSAREKRLYRRRNH